MHSLLLNLVFVILVSNPVQEKQANVLINSIREFGGNYANSQIYLFQGDTVNAPCKSLISESVNLIPLEIDKSLPNYPFIQKMEALAQAEKLLAAKAETMVWMDADALVLNEPVEFDLLENKKLAIRPVNLRNNVGLSAKDSVDKYWEKIYELIDLKVENVPIVETYVDTQMVRSYLNCAIFSMRPNMSILQESLDIFKRLLYDQEYQIGAITTINHIIFLHQAILSAVMVSKIKEDEIHWFSMAAGYPLHHYKELTLDKRPIKVNDLESLIYAYSWGTSRWLLDEIQIDEPLRTWLERKYEIVCKVTDNILREETLCNSYLIKTKDGYVMIDPGGASDSANSILYSKNIKPKVILITHGHTDHTQGIELWKFGRDIPVIAQEKHKEFTEYNHMLAKYFDTRNAVQGNVITEKELKIQPDIFFDHEYTYEFGGLHFKMIHTPGETPDQSTIWIPELKAAFIADNYYKTFPNLAPLRGSKPRWALEYISALDTILALHPEMVFPGHGEPIIGKEEVQRKVKLYRDAIQYIHDETVKGMNEGKDVYSLMHDINLPENFNSIGQDYGRVSWSVRGIYDGYTGWFDGNPSNMYDVPPSAIYTDLVKLAGSEAIVKRANELTNLGEPVKALHLTDVILEGDPYNKQALEARVQALRFLRFKCKNGIEFQNISNGLRIAFQKLSSSK
jgi:glyoxylase-like metal-dependent hydrolase (beta-lactamase superfamily II)